MIVPRPLHVAIARTAQTEALMAGMVRSDLVRLSFADMPVISRAFAPMVRELRFDASEMAIATFLQARAHGRPLVLLPVVLAARFQESALLCRAGSDIASPADLAGRRVGVRAYSQTTGLWLRGMLSERYGIAPDRIDWVTFEEAHTAGVRDPPWARRAAADKSLLGMLKAGEIDAAIFGNDTPSDPELRTVFADPQAAADAFWQAHRLVPINHMLAVPRTLAEASPEIVVELIRMFAESKRLGLPPRDARDPHGIGREAAAPGVALALRFAIAQGLVPATMTPADVWDGSPD